MSASAENVAMPDADMNGVVDAAAAAAENAEELLLGGEKKLVILAGASSHAASFQIEKEDHTLGNALRYFVSKNPDVEFCGYTIPHPSETKMNIRIQTWEDTNTSAFDALKKGLEDMMEACDVIVDKFTEARDQFDGSQKNGS